MRRKKLLHLVLLILLVLPASGAVADDDVIPDQLKEWVPWVLRDNPEIACPIFSNARICAWPGRLNLRLNSRGGRFSLDVRADRELDLPLPGDVEHWPDAIKVDGKAGLLRRGRIPTVHLDAGDHRITGRFRWTRLPTQLAVAPSIGLVDLSIDGVHITHPAREADGSLILKSGDNEEGKEAEEDVLAMEVHRRIDDGVPVQVRTRLKLRVSGQAREEDLGSPLTEGFEPIEVTSNLPARLDENGRLQVQLRPGTWQVTIRSRSTGPVSQIGPGKTTAPWPEEEVWVFSAATAVRAVQVGGVPGVDPQRTSLDHDWRSLPAFRVGREQALSFTELRRGEGEPPPDSLVVDREIWLSEKGGGLIVQDTIEGQFHQGGRLELLNPGELGHVKVGGRGRVIIQSQDGAAQGVEIRAGRIRMVAESSYPDAGTLPAVGWNRDATNLRASLILPPGWTLLAASGVDSAATAWVERWSLLDLFFLLLITIALVKTVELRWGVLGLLVLGISWHEPDSPRLGWLVLVGLSALLGLSLRPWLKKSFRVARMGVIGVLGVQIAIFSWAQVSTGLFPQLEHNGRSPYSGSSYEAEDEYGAPGGAFGELQLGEMPEPMVAGSSRAAENEAVEESQARLIIKSAPNQQVQQAAAPKSLKKRARKRASQVDLTAIIQTGQGVPRWSWDRHPLQWSGPVASDHEAHLFLLPPWSNGLASLLRVLGLVLLLIRLAGLRRDPPADPAGESGGSITPIAALLLFGAGLLLPATAWSQSTPNQQTLEELKRHLSKPPDCGKECVDVASIILDAGKSGIRIEAELHVLAPSAWALPGPGKVWQPSKVSVDGKPVIALRRLRNGYFALRLDKGLHRVVLSGPARDEVNLQFPLTPRRLTWTGRNWSIDGFRPDAAPPPSVTLRRAEGLQPDASSPKSAQDMAASVLPAWLELRRELDIGVPWLVHNRLQRLSPANRSVHVRVPLLKGEAVTSSGIVVEEGQALITLERGESNRTWDSTLEEAGSLVLTAPTDRPWMERWELDCSPTWSCATEGLAPTRHMASGRWSPRWQPWPGESLEFTFSKPLPASGASTTVDDASLVVEPGRRVLAGSLDFHIRSSQGGKQSIQLPPIAQVQTFEINGVRTPLDVQEGKIAYTLRPGQHRVRVSWRQDQEAGLWVRAPSVSLSSGAANVLVKMTMPDNKWLLWTGGPKWGAVVTLWQYVLVLLLAAWLLGRYAPTVLKGRHWFIFGLGMTQVPMIAPIVVVAWLITLGMRGSSGQRPPLSHNLLQLVLVALTPIALLMIYWAVHSGLLLQPDMQVAGAGSSGSLLQWFEQRTDGAFPEPWVLWLPLWVWRVGMLLWALWLAIYFFRWGSWGWQQFSVGGLWKKQPKTTEPPKA